MATPALRAVADPQRLSEVARLEPEELASLEADIAAFGIRQVLELVVDPRGRLRLRDGHHRVLIAERLAIARLPVLVRPSDGVHGFGRPTIDVLELMLTPAFG